MSGPVALMPCAGIVRLVPMWTWPLLTLPIALSLRTIVQLVTVRIGPIFRLLGCAAHACLLAHGLLRRVRLSLRFLMMPGPCRCLPMWIRCAGLRHVLLVLLLNHRRNLRVQALISRNFFGNLVATMCL